MDHNNRSPIVVDASSTRAALAFDKLIPALRAAFIAGAEAPLRTRHAVGGDASLLMMPAWRAGRAIGVKLVSVFPANNARGMEAVSSTYLLCDGATGRHLAILDGNEITGRRTAAASALAGTFLARETARELLVVGAGHIASLMPAAWRTARKIERVTVWNRHPDRAAALAGTLRAAGFDAYASDDLETAAGRADIISCATLATEPLIRGAWLKRGAHLDLIGAFTPAMRETDDDAISRARVFIDTDAALKEAGDLVQAVPPPTIAGDLAALCRGTVPGRRTADEITLFKSVGSALEDLAAAELVYAEAMRSASRPMQSAYLSDGL